MGLGTWDLGLGIWVLLSTQTQVGFWVGFGGIGRDFVGRVGGFGVLGLREWGWKSEIRKMVCWAANMGFFGR